MSYGLLTEIFDFQPATRYDQRMDLREILKTFAVGLTGGIATGKSTVAAILRAKGYMVIDADQLARRVVAAGSDGLAAIIANFGPDLVTTDGQLDRAKLRQIIFKDQKARKRLEAITHPRIRQALEDTIATARLQVHPQLFFYEAALLFETGTAADFRSIWATTCPLATQRARVMARDHLEVTDAERILASQMPATEKAMHASLAIDTNCSYAELEQRVSTALAAELARG